MKWKDQTMYKKVGREKAINPGSVDWKQKWIQHLYLCKNLLKNKTKQKKPYSLPHYCGNRKHLVEMKHWQAAKQESLCQGRHSKKKSTTKNSSNVQCKKSQRNKDKQFEGKQR